MGVEKIFSFGSWDTDHPADRHPGERIDAQFDSHANAIRALEARIDAIVRADGKLHAEVIPIFSPRQIVAPKSGFSHPGSTNVATLSDAAAENWAEVSMEWAEHMPDTIPGNILASNAITGDHWSSRWWANQAARTAARGTVAAVKLQNFTFNGVTTTFPLLDTTAAPIVPATNVSQLSIVVDGVTQEPGVDFVLALGGASVTFTSAPAADARNFAIYFLQGTTSVGDAGTVGAVLFSTRAAAAAAIIPVAVQAIATGGYIAAGDAGGSLYYRIAGPTAGGFQSADGAWWALAGNPVNVRWQSLGDADAALTLTLGDTGAANRFGLTSPLTAPRTVSIPLAASVPKGTSLAVADLVGGVSNANTLTVARAGSDLIDGQASAVLSAAYDGLVLVSDGSSKWHIESGWRSRASKTRFWSDVDNGAAITTPRILTHRERIFLGAAIDYSTLAQTGAATFGWLTNVTGANWMPRDSSIAVVSEYGSIGVSGASRASDGPGGAIGIAGFGVADSATLGDIAWGGYFEAVRQNAAASALGVEIAVRNAAAGSVAPTPANLGSGPTGLWINCGPTSGAGGYGPTALGNAGAAIGINQNDDGTPANVFKFQTGIVFMNNALSGSTGADGEAASATALAMARGQAIRWFDVAGTNKVAIQSLLNTTDANASLYWSGTATIFSRNGNTEDLLRLVSIPSAVNYIQISNSIAAFPAQIAAAGASADIDLQLVSKGAGTLRFGTHAAKAAEAFSGYITIKDSGGVSRKVMVCA